MFCPACGQEQKCGCPSCKNGGIVWKNLDNDAVACGKCGFTQHIDFWENLGMLIAEQSFPRNSFGGVRRRYTFPQIMERYFPKGIGEWPEFGVPSEGTAV